MIYDDAFAETNKTYNYTLTADDVAIDRSTISVTVLDNDGKFSSLNCTYHILYLGLVLGFTPSHYTVVEVAHVLVLFNISVIHGISQEKGISIEFSTRNGSASCMCIPF